MDHAVEQL